LWRTTGDISPLFDGEVDHGTWKSWGVMKIVEMREGIRVHAGPGHWNDPDMLEVGNGMSANEDRSHFTLWCLMAAPLMAGNDLRSMSKEMSEILCNREVIAVDQDSLGIQGFRLSTADSVETWAKPLARGDWAVCFLNRSAVTKAMNVDWMKIVIHDELSGRTFDAGKHAYRVRDLWQKKNLGTTKATFATNLTSHNVLLFRMTEE